MPASYSGAEAAIRARLEANWNTTPIVVENEDPPAPWPPVDADGLLMPFVMLEVVNSGSEIVGQGVPGNHPFEYWGLIFAHVFVPKGTGKALASQYADQIGEIFRTKTFYDDQQAGCYVRTWSPRHGNGGPAVDEKAPTFGVGDWWCVTMACDFEYRHRG